MDNMLVLLEDTWEADDVREECERLKIPCRELTVEQLSAYEPREFVDSVYMCNTEIVQRKLRDAFGEAKFDAVVPCTYPQSLASLFHRKIDRKLLSRVEAEDLPVFIKPATNDKAFDGRVVRDTTALATLRKEATEYSGETHEVEIYVSTVVEFWAEYRLFVGAGNLYGMGMIRDVRKQKSDTTVQLSDSCQGDPPRAFVDDVLACCGDHAFWVVDVGVLVATCPGQSQWAVVEVNPPFALDDHGLHIEPYCRYCIDACAWIRTVGCSS